MLTDDPAAVESATRVAIVGNAGGGKTTLARALAARLDLPLTHVDSIQFLAGLERRPIEETAARLREVASQGRWIIDGFGPLDVMRERFRAADVVVFVDFPLWRHFLWATRRQLRSGREPRRELPPDCNEASLGRTLGLYRIMLRVHRHIRPALVSCFDEIETSVVRVTTPAQWRAVERVSPLVG